MTRIAGTTVSRTVTPVSIWYAGRGQNIIIKDGNMDASRAIDGAHTSYTHIIRAGFFMAYNSSTKLWVPCKRTVVSQNTETSGGSGNTSITVDDARSFRAGDVCTIGGDTSKTLESVDYTNNLLVFDSVFDADDGDAVFCSENGEGIARGILLDDVNLHDSDGAEVDRPCRIAVAGGLVDPDQLKGDDVAIRAASGMFISFLQFSDDHGA